MQDIASFHGYRYPWHRKLLFWALCLLTGGALFIFTRWFLRLRVALTLVPCPLSQADYVVVTVGASWGCHHCTQWEGRLCAMQCKRQAWGRGTSQGRCVAAAPPGAALPAAAASAAGTLLPLPMPACMHGPAS